MMKLKTLAASFALAFGGAAMTPAFAAINLDGLQNGGTLGGNTFADPAFDPFNYSIGGVGELFLSVVARDVNPANDRSYVRDLGISSRTLIDARDNGTLGNQGFSFAPDATMTSFLAANSGKTFSFFVMGVHNPSGFDPNTFAGRNLGYLLTSTLDADTINAQQPQGTNGFVVSGAEIEFQSFVGGINLKTDGSPIGDPAANLSATFEPGEFGFHTAAIGQSMFDFNTEATGLGSSASFFFLSADNTDNSISAMPELLGTWTLSATGNLDFTPVPVPAAAWLMGSAVLGLAGAARRRRA